MCSPGPVLLWPSGHLLPACAPHPPRGLPGSREPRCSRNCGKEQRHPGRRPWEIGGGIFPGHGCQCPGVFVAVGARKETERRTVLVGGPGSPETHRARGGRQTRVAGVTTKWDQPAEDPQQQRERHAGEAGGSSVPEASARDESHAGIRSPGPGREGGSRRVGSRALQNADATGPRGPPGNEISRSIAWSVFPAAHVCTGEFTSQVQCEGTHRRNSGVKHRSSRRRRKSHLKQEHTGH